jgi:CDP-diglyceride synthetase
MPLNGPQPEQPPGGGLVGFVFGLAIGLLIAAWWWIGLDAGWLSLAPPLVISVLAAKFGDRFWHWFRERLRWFY